MGRRMDSIIDFLSFRLFEREDFMAFSSVDVKGGELQARCYRRGRFSVNRFCRERGRPVRIARKMTLAIPVEALAISSPAHAGGTDLITRDTLRPNRKNQGRLI